MAITTDNQIALHRVVMFALGGLCGLALWALGEQWNNPALPAAAYLALFCFVATYASVALVLAGPVSVARALWGALIPATVLTCLISIAGLRLARSTEVLDDPVMLTVAALLVLFSTPFLLVWLQDRRFWRSYAHLFDAAWTMTVRYGVAWGFVAVFWLVVFLGNALLDLVDVTAIDVVLRTDWARFSLSGAILGLGLAVVYELRGTISPYLFLRLLRLLVPVVLTVVLVFLVAVPLRGLTHLFGEFSAASTLMGAAIAAITLISAALDKDDSAAVRTRGLRLATRGLALVLPLLGVLAVWAVVLRVHQYGWTPDRILAFAVSLFLLIYGLGYCGSVLARTGWMGRIRQVNTAMALTVLAVGMVWMTPVLDVYRLSTNSQIKRFDAGQLSLDQLALWQMAHDWGRAGQAGLTRLEAMTQRPDHAGLVERIGTVRAETNPYQFEQAILRQTAPDRAATLFETLPVRPSGQAVALQKLIDIPTYRVDGWLQGCDQTLEDGQAACVLILGGFMPSASPDDQAVVLYLGPNGQVRADYVHWHDGEVSVSVMFDAAAGSWPELTPEAISGALDGAFEVRPSGVAALFLNGAALVPVP